MCRPKHVEQLGNIGIINSITWLHLVGSLYEFYITMHGSINFKYLSTFLSRKVQKKKLLGTSSRFFNCKKRKQEKNEENCETFSFFVSILRLISFRVTEG